MGWPSLLRRGHRDPEYSDASWCFFYPDAEKSGSGRRFLQSERPFRKSGLSPSFVKLKQLFLEWTRSSLYIANKVFFKLGNDAFRGVSVSIRVGTRQACGGGQDKKRFSRCNDVIL